MRRYRVIRIAISTILCFLVFAVVLYYIPLPTKVDMELTCAEVSKDGNVLLEGVAHVEGWQLNYLFQSDRLILESVSLPGLYYSLRTHEDCPLSISTAKELLYIGGPVFYDDTRLFITLSVEGNWDTFLIALSQWPEADGERFFACSVEENIHVSEIWEIHYWLAP